MNWPVPLPLTASKGCQDWHQIGSDRPNMGQIWDFLKSVPVNIGLETVPVKKSQICLICSQSDTIWCQTWHPDYKLTFITLAYPTYINTHPWNTDPSGKSGQSWPQIWVRLATNWTNLETFKRYILAHNIFTLKYSHTNFRPSLTSLPCQTQLTNKQRCQIWPHISPDWNQ